MESSKRKWYIEVIRYPERGLFIQDIVDKKIMGFKHDASALTSLIHVLKGGNMEGWDGILKNMPTFPREYCQNHGLKILSDEEIKTIIKSNLKQPAGS